MKQITLIDMGWKPFFQQQLSLDEYENNVVARVISVHRDRLEVMTEQGEQSCPLNAHWHELEVEERATVGDWILLSDSQFVRLLDRQSLVQRISAGTEPKPQLIAANIDTLFIVSSCNKDFNVGRLERYLSLAISSDIQPVIVLTKVDLTADAKSYLEKAQNIRPEIPVICLNSLVKDNLNQLNPWLTRGATVAFVGSSGVGKSTLINTLLGEQSFSTQGIREDDAKGRHTTTSRNLVRLLSGSLVIDTPGMREIRLGEDQDGVEQVFDDIEQLVSRCRFSDCHHEGDLGCAITEAIAKGELDPKRFARYQKLLRETEYARMSQADHRKKNKAFGKMVKQVLDEKERYR